MDQRSDRSGVSLTDTLQVAALVLLVLAVAGELLVCGLAVILLSALLS